MNYQDAFDIELQPGQSLLARLGPYHTSAAGDAKIIWNRSNETEVGIARDAFNKAKRAGFMAYKVEGKDGAKGAEILGDFDPNAERIILAPPMRGGR